MANVVERPLSPFLSVWRIQISMFLSGLHRITGVALVIGILLFAWWIIAAGAGPDAFSVVQGFVGSWIGMLMLFGWTFSLFYHLCNGIRHMLWDIGTGLTVDGIKTGGWIMAGSALALTLLCWVVGIAAYA